ncbi:Flavodoxin reductases (ferredoxin-NADPH reductases) family 1; Vanillate O-demethylase oxidoreductase [Leucobacter sp. 7(1)]|uniref:PDR/VanB family oxidoreductase n=1 Tax=Leucobacter sp. 7(1) TaxID=1255613 RepID=UPI00097ECD8A|nr:PDR/VanB family oxidoreductase [Leucobacter sp. 7(1)]SJN11755.1 Flavodoxin reductases (ferredoxin-NADPH reductases) family 1; Vanillate O-demethylase oxidoreductase [Leucobacter sp. 7(1)]
MVDKQLAWQTARVLACTEVADGIRRIDLAPDHPVPAKPGTHVDVGVHLPDGRTDTRSYSVVGASKTGDRIAISIYRTPTSRGGSEFMHGVQPGDELKVTAPVQDFPLRIGAPAYVLVAGGVGITAIRGMASVLKRLGASYELHYVGTSVARMAYREELRAVHGDRLVEHITEEHGRMSVAELIVGLPAAAELYMCGPIRLMEEIRRTWERSDRDITALRYETFGNSGWFEAEPFEVVVPQYNVTVEVQPTESMLEALERAGVDMMFDCRRGECGLCEVRIVELDGQVDHRDVFYSERQKAPNSKMCGCVSRVIAGTGSRSADTGTAHAAADRHTGRCARVVVEVS